VFTAVAALEADMIGLLPDKLMSNWNYKAQTYNTEWAYMDSKSGFPVDTGFKLHIKLQVHHVNNFHNGDYGITEVRPMYEFTCL
jgi:hypothetical protein